MNVDGLRRQVAKLRSQAVGDRVIVVSIPAKQIPDSTTNSIERQKRIAEFERNRDRLLLRRLAELQIEEPSDSDVVIFVKESGKGMSPYALGD